MIRRSPTRLEAACQITSHPYVLFCFRDRFFTDYILLNLFPVPWGGGGVVIEFVFRDRSFIQLSSCQFCLCTTHNFDVTKEDYLQIPLSITLYLQHSLYITRLGATLCVCWDQIISFYSSTLFLYGKANNISQKFSPLQKNGGKK